VTSKYSRPASVRRPITVERTACQADPVIFGLFGRQLDASRIFAVLRAIFGP
jgi:hypothetical protein